MGTPTHPLASFLASFLSPSPSLPPLPLIRSFALASSLILPLIIPLDPLTPPQANKLSTIKKCLNEVLKYGGPYSPRDLYPYHLALHQIDSLRKDGKFYADDGSIPEGQAILVAQLSEAHELLEMLKESMSDEDEEEEEEE
jgi:hypothetical protein